MQTAELLSKVRHLEIRSRHLVEDLFSGGSESIFKGRGVEFEEVRPYIAGDEVRDIDWNVTARLGTPYIKRFVEERELTVMLVVDASASMRFGTTGSEKRELAAELCAIFGFAAIRNNDRVGLVLAGSDVEHFVPPARGHTHLLRLLRDVLNAETSRGAVTANVTRFVMRTTRRRSLVFWISDFEDPIDEGDWRVLARRHDVTAFALRDPRDDRLPAVGWLELEDLEAGGRVLVNTDSRGVRDTYARQAAQRRMAVERTLQRAQCPWLELRTDAPYMPALIRYFAQKRRGRSA